MLDFTLVREKKTTIAELARPLSRTDLARLTNEMVDTMLGIIEDATDADVVFQPKDPGASDPVRFERSAEERQLDAWSRRRPCNGLGRGSRLPGRRARPWRARSWPLAL